MSEFESLLRKIRTRTLKILNISKEEEEKGLELHKKFVVCDSLLDYITPYSNRMVKRTEEMLNEGISSQEIDNEMNRIKAIDISSDLNTKKEYIDVWNHAGVTCGSVTVGSDSVIDAIKRISNAKYQIDRLKDEELLAICTDDIKRAKKEGKHAFIWNFQNTILLGGGVDIDKELNILDLFYGLGVRVVQLTYNLRNFVGDGCTERYESGLSYFGLRVLERMNKLGMLIDTAHCGYQTTLDASEFSSMPIAATHTACKSVYMHDRNKTDEELKAIAEKGGYIGILTFPPFLGGKSTMKEFLDHIDYAVNLIGAEHVGIGTDAWYKSHVPQRLTSINPLLRSARGHIGYEPLRGGDWWRGWRHEEPKASNLFTQEMWEELNEGSLAWVNWPYITVGLVSRGYSDKEIEGIIGGNFLRILERVIG